MSPLVVSVLLLLVVGVLAYSVWEAIHVSKN